MVDLVRHLVLVELMALLYYLEESSAVIQECSDVCDFYEWGRDAQCQGRNLESVPQECLHAKTLQMQDNRLAKLAEGAFRNFTCLKYLYLERNNMTVEMGAFQGCSKLEKVHLNQNHLPNLTRGILDGMPKVLYMFLDNASVLEIQPSAFINLPQLRFLSLENNRLNTPPCDAFGPDTSLETLYLTGNNISNLPNDCFTGFNRLTKLYLKKNPLINPNPLAFKGLDSLTLLDLQFTNLTEVPTGIFQNAINIEKLYLSFNNISHLSNRDFMSLYRLTHLHLQHNNLLVIQEQSFEFLGALHTLDISFNRISSIKENTLSHLGNLKDLKLQSNLLNSTRNISFIAIPNDTKVHLADNPLRCDCFLEPFLIWSKAASISVLEDARSSLHLARCSTPPEFAGRLVLSLRHSDICPLETKVVYESVTMSPPGMGMEEKMQDISDRSPALSPMVMAIIISVVVVSIVVVMVLFMIIFIRTKRRRSEKNCQGFHEPEHRIQITPNALDPEIIRGHEQITSTVLTSLPSRRSIDDVNDDPYYISLDGDVPCRSAVHAPMHLPIHHPMPPHSSPQSDMASSNQSMNISEPTQDVIVYSSVLPDGNPHPIDDNGVTYTSVRTDDAVPDMRPLSMMSEVPIEEWVRDNCQLDADTNSYKMTDNSELKLPAENAGSPYVTTITRK